MNRKVAKTSDLTQRRRGAEPSHWCLVSHVLGDVATRVGKFSPRGELYSRLKSLSSVVRSFYPATLERAVSTFNKAMDFATIAPSRFTLPIRITDTAATLRPPTLLHIVHRG